MQYLPVADRLDSGPLKVGNDWPGVFIRGDEAMGFVTILKSVKIEYNAADELIKLLESCHVDFID
jgi:hypothetical protein